VARDHHESVAPVRAAECCAPRLEVLPRGMLGLQRTQSRYSVGAVTLRRSLEQRNVQRLAGSDQRELCVGEVLRTVRKQLHRDEVFSSHDS